MQEAESALNEARQRLTELEAARRARQDERSLKAGEQAKLQARLDVLAQAEQSLSGYAEGRVSCWRPRAGRAGRGAGCTRR